MRWIGKIREFVNNNGTTVLFCGNLLVASAIFLNFIAALISIYVNRQNAVESGRLAIENARLIAETSRENIRATETLIKSNQLVVLQDIRSRFIDLNRHFHEMDIFNYPKNGKHYGAVERQVVSRYWDEIVFHEFMMCKIFQGGMMKEQWEKHYKPLIRHSLKNPVMKQEYAFFRSNSPIYYDTDVGKTFLGEIDELSGLSDVDRPKVVAEREKDISEVYLH